MKRPPMKPPLKTRHPSLRRRHQRSWRSPPRRQPLRTKQRRLPRPPLPRPRHQRPLPPSSPAARGAPATSAFGRVGTDGIVYVTTADGEREVGSYPGVSNAEALAYFGRKYDELAASLQLLHQRVTHTEIPAKEAAETAGKLRAQVAEARVVGDLAALAAQLDDVDAAIVARREADSAARAAAKIVATTQREALVAEAEQISGQPEHKIQWKASGARMRELLDAWKNAQRIGPRLDKDVEAALWHRFSVARNSFDKARRTHFAALDSAHEQAKTTKERLVAEAERMAGSRDWMATAGAFKRLMDDWRAAGRAGRAEDDALWQRFKAAQDTFFTAKDAVVQAEEDSYRANLAVKEALLADAEAILPVTDLEKAKAALRVIQDKWDKAGKVPAPTLSGPRRPCAGSSKLSGTPKTAAGARPTRRPPLGPAASSNNSRRPSLPWRRTWPTPRRPAMPRRLPRPRPPSPRDGSGSTRPDLALPSSAAADRRAPCTWVRGIPPGRYAARSGQSRLVPVIR